MTQTPGNKERKDARADDIFHLAYLHPRYWLTWLGIGLSFIISLLPYRMILQLGRLLGRIVYRVARKRVHIARVNLQKCYPQLDASATEALLRKNFRSVGIGVMEVVIAWWWPRCRLESKVSYRGLEHLQAGKGTILMVMHFTTIELAGRLITQRHSVDATYREHGNPVFEYIQRRLRHRFDPNSQLLGRRDVRGILRSLKGGRTVWYSPDQDYGIRNGLFVPFFGVEAATVTGTSRLAKSGNAQVVPMMVTRLDDAQGYEVCLYPPLADISSGDDYQDTLQLNRFIEQRVREHPEQYMWLHRRFKNRPEGEADFYR